MPAPNGDRYYNECPQCKRSDRVTFVAERLLYTARQWKPDDPLPEYRENCTCGNCGRSWSQTRKGSIGRLQ